MTLEGRVMQGTGKKWGVAVQGMSMRVFMYFLKIYKAFLFYILPNFFLTDCHQNISSFCQAQIFALFHKQCLMEALCLTLGLKDVFLCKNFYVFIFSIYICCIE